MCHTKFYHANYLRCVFPCRINIFTNLKLDNIILMKQRCVFPCRINIFTNLKYHFNEANIFQLKDWIDFILQPLFVRLQWGREVKKNILECNETNIYCVIERFLLLALLKVFKAYAHWFWSCFQLVYVDSTRKMWRDGWLGTENLSWLGTEKLERMVDSARKNLKG